VTETYDTEEKLIEHLKGEFYGNDKTQIGSAFHYIIETGCEKQSEITKAFKVTFNHNHFQTALSHRSSISPFVPEIRHQKLFDTGKYKLLISGATDVLQGITLRDNKCKFSTPKYEDYYNSYQWRIYLSIFGLNRFIFDVFEFIGYKEGLDVSGCELKQHEPMECVRYKKMESDILTLINDFMEWIEFRNLQKYI
jgi:hypothetical protein